MEELDPRPYTCPTCLDAAQLLLIEAHRFLQTLQEKVDVLTLEVLRRQCAEETRLPDDVLRAMEQAWSGEKREEHA